MRIRPTVRLIVVDQQQRILLYKVDDTIPVHVDRPAMIVYWNTPGGGIEPGESFEQAACRELWEETGIQIDYVGPWIWHYDRLLHFPNGSLMLRERFYLVMVATPQVTLTNLLPHEQETHRGLRWWALDEIIQSDEPFMPPGLARLLQPILEGEIPDEPLTIDGQQDS